MQNARPLTQPVDLDPTRCVVLVPVAAHIEPECHDALIKLAARGYTVRELRGCSQVDLARGIMASRALEDGFTETMWIDSDIVFDPADVDRLRAHNRPICAGLYAKKGEGKGIAANFAPGMRELTFGKGGCLLTVQNAGLGFCHIRSRVYEAVKRDCTIPTCQGSYDGKPFTPYFLPTVAEMQGGGAMYLSEDLSFFLRAASVGFPVLADTRIRLEHVGRKLYSWESLAPEKKLESYTHTFAPTPEISSEPSVRRGPGTDDRPVSPGNRAPEARRSAAPVPLG